VILGLTYGFSPFMILPLYASIERMDRLVVGELRPRARQGLHILPSDRATVVSPGLVAGASSFVFIPAVGDFITPELLGGVQTQMLGHHDRRPVRRRQQLALERHCQSC
jgi:spermidine/putrescine transport system permease protein